MKKNLKAGRGFTLVELLVVVLILAILMAVALPFYLSAVRNSERGTARTNMQTIATAEQALRASASDHSYQPIDDTSKSVVLPDLPNGPVGPNGRTYKVDTTLGGKTCDDIGDGTGKAAVPVGGIAITSTTATDGCFVPGVTSN